MACKLPKPLQVPWGLPQSPECWQPARRVKLLQCRLQTPRKERPRTSARVEAVPMPWNNENKSLVCTTQRRRLSPLLMSAMQRAQVMVLLNSVHLVHLWNTTPKRSSAHSRPSAAHCNWGAGAGVSEPSVRHLPLDVKWFVRTGKCCASK